MRSDVMPWKESSAASEQSSFIEAWMRGEDTVAGLCRRFGISRKTGHKRISRYRQYGMEGIGDRSRAPHSHPNRTSVEIARRLIEAKRTHPTWGPKKVVAWLRMVEPEVSWPAASTAGGILERVGLVKRRRRRRATSRWSEPFAAAEHANDVWCMDFKGWIRTADSKRIDPLTVQDASSRYLLVCRGLEQPRGDQVRRTVRRAFGEYGLPGCIRTDNGTPFASVGLGGLSRLGVWWVKLGIVPERIEPGHPEQNGRLERLHRTLKSETVSPPGRNRRSQQRTFDEFRHRYNEERPHEALGQKPPAREYQRSMREYPSRLRSPEYGSEANVRRVRTNGQIKWKGSLIYLSEALVGEPVGLYQEDTRTFRIQFGPLIIGLLDVHSNQVIHIPTKVLPMSPV